MDPVASLTTQMLDFNSPLFTPLWIILYSCLIGDIMWYHHIDLNHVCVAFIEYTCVYGLCHTDQACVPSRKMTF